MTQTFGAQSRAGRAWGRRGGAGCPRALCEHPGQHAVAPARGRGRGGNGGAPDQNCCAVSMMYTIPFTSIAAGVVSATSAATSALAPAPPVVRLCLVQAAPRALPYRPACLWPRTAREAGLRVRRSAIVVRYRRRCRQRAGRVAQVCCSVGRAPSVAFARGQS